MTTPLTPAERDELRERNEFSQPHDRAYALWSEIVALLDERDRLASALEQIDNLDPNYFTQGQEHVAPAFREPNVKEAWRHVCRIVNGVLYGTDENGVALGGDPQ